MASDSTRSKIFQLAQQLNFFQGKFKISHSAKANVATNSLTLTDGSIENQITYTSSKNSLIRQLTMLSKNISATLEFGRRLERLRHSNPSGLTAELEQMGRMSRRGRLVEFPALAPVMQRIASDEALSEISRRYARSILKDSGSQRN